MTTPALMALNFGTPGMVGERQACAWLGLASYYAHTILASRGALASKLLACTVEAKDRRAWMRAIAFETFLLLLCTCNTCVRKQALTTELFGVRVEGEGRLACARRYENTFLRLCTASVCITNATR